MDHLEAIERETALLRDAVVDLGAPVPSCPGWDVAELLRHVGTAHHNAATIVGERLDHHPALADVQPSVDVDPLDWLVSSSDALVDVLRRTPSDTPVWTFGPDRTAAFWARRMAQETMVHRVDAEQAANLGSTLDRELADDGIEESLQVFVPLLAARSQEPAGGELLLHALDGRSWVLTFGTGAVDVVADHRQGDACV